MDAIDSRDAQLRSRFLSILRCFKENEGSALAARKRNGDPAIGHTLAEALKPIRVVAHLRSFAAGGDAGCTVDFTARYTSGNLCMVADSMQSCAARPRKEIRHAKKER